MGNKVTKKIIEDSAFFKGLDGTSAKPRASTFSLTFRVPTIEQAHDIASLFNQEMAAINAVTFPANARTQHMQAHNLAGLNGYIPAVLTEKYMNDGKHLDVHLQALREAADDCKAAGLQNELVGGKLYSNQVAIDLKDIGPIRIATLIKILDSVLAKSKVLQEIVAEKKINANFHTTDNFSDPQFRGAQITTVEDDWREQIRKEMTKTAARKTEI